MQGLNKHQRRLYKELKKTFTEAGIDDIEWYTDFETPSSYQWRFDMLSYHFIWTLDKQTMEISKEEKKIINK